MSSARPISQSHRCSVALLLAIGLAGCSDKPAPAAVAAEPERPTASTTTAAQRRAAWSGLDARELKTRGDKALREQRLFAPAGDNAMEYYLALRSSSDTPDASTDGALADLQPYLVIAVEQAVNTYDFVEAERLRNLIAAADPQAPSLARIADDIVKGKLALTARLSEQAAQIAEAANVHEAVKPEAVQAAAVVTPKVVVAPTSATKSAPPVAQSIVAPANPPPVAAPALPSPVPARGNSELVAIRTPQPDYPEGRHLGALAEVIASFTVNADGSVSNIDTVATGAGRIAFERSVQATVKRWKFQPISSPQDVTRRFSFSP